MSEEEKKAIEKIKELIAHKNDVDLFMGYEISRPFTIGREMIEEIEPILNLIEKQQKEIEKLKQYEIYYKEQCEVNKQFIAKRKIETEIEKAKIRISKLHPASDIQEMEWLEDKIKTLQELLEE